jgi:hypothetical protein
MNVITVTLPDETIETVAQRAATVVESRLRRDEKKESQPRWVDKHGAANFLSFSVSKIEKLTTANRIPHHHHDGRVHYRTDELDEWLGQG